MPSLTDEQQRLEQEIARLKERLAQLTPEVVEPPTPSTPKSDADWSIVDRPAHSEEVKSELFPTLDARQSYLNLVHTKLKKLYREDEWSIYSIQEAMNAPTPFKPLATQQPIDLSKVDFLLISRNNPALWVLVQCSWTTRSGLFSNDNYYLCMQVRDLLKSPNPPLTTVVVQRWYPDCILPMTIDGVTIVDIHCPIEPESLDVETSPVQESDAKSACTEEEDNDSTSRPLDTPLVVKGEPVPVHLQVDEQKQIEPVIPDVPLTHKEESYAHINGRMSIALTQKQYTAYVNKVSQKLRCIYGATYMIWYGRAIDSVMNQMGWNPVSDLSACHIDILMTGCDVKSLDKIRVIQCSMTRGASSCYSGEGVLIPQIKRLEQAQKVRRGCIEIERWFPYESGISTSLQKSGWIDDVYVTEVPYPLDEHTPTTLSPRMEYVQSVLSKIREENPSCTAHICQDAPILWLKRCLRTPVKVNLDTVDIIQMDHVENVCTLVMCSVSPYPNVPVSFKSTFEDDVKGIAHDVRSLLRSSGGVVRLRYWHTGVLGENMKKLIGWETLFRRFPIPVPEKDGADQKQPSTSSIEPIPVPVPQSTPPIPFTDDEFQVYLHDIVKPALQKQYPDSLVYFYASSITRVMTKAGLIRYVTCEDIDILLVDRSHKYHLIQCSQHKVGKPSFRGNLPHQVDGTSSHLKLDVQRWYPDVAPDVVMVAGVMDVYAPFVHRAVQNGTPEVTNVTPPPPKPLFSSENQPHVDTITRQLNTEQKKCVIVRCQPRSTHESLVIDLGYQWTKSMSDYRVHIIHPCESQNTWLQDELTKYLENKDVCQKWVLSSATNGDALAPLQLGNESSTTPTLVVIQDYMSGEHVNRTEMWRAYLHLLEGANRQVVVLTTTDPPLDVPVLQDKCAITTLHPSSDYVGLQQLYIEGRVLWGTTFHDLSNVRTLFREQIVNTVSVSNPVRPAKIHFIRCGTGQAYQTRLNLERVAHEFKVRIEVLELDKLDIKDVYEWTRNVIPAHKHTFVIMTKELPAGQFIYPERLGFLHDVCSPISSYRNSLVGRACILSRSANLNYVLYTDVDHVLQYLISMNDK